MLYRISVTERGLTGIANIFRSRLSKLDDLLGAGTVPLNSRGGISHAPLMEETVPKRLPSTSESENEQTQSCSDT